METNSTVQRGVNWIPDRNRFQLAAPPNWFLDDLWVFDDALVLLPSRMLPIYRLARRTKNTAGFKFIAEMSKGSPIAPDTKMMANYGVIPVASITSGSIWSPQVFAELARRDVWRAGGAKKAADTLDEQDVSERKAIDAKIDDELTQRVERSYESYRYRTGQRLSMTTPGAQVRTPPQPQSPAVDGQVVGS